METTLKPAKPKRDLSHINNVLDLQDEARLLRLKIKAQEEVLRDHLKALPKETLKLGAKSAVQPLMQNKVLGLAITGATALAGNFFVKKAAATASRSLFSSLTSKGLFAAGQFLLGRLLAPKKKKKA